MPRILIVVHGMGVSHAGWAESIVTKLNAVTKRYAVFENQPPVFLLAKDADDDSQQPSPDQVLVVPAGYDETMQARVKSFQKDATAILDLATSKQITLPPALKTLLGSLDNAGEEEKNFFWTHVVDVLLYRYFALVTTPVRLDVMTAIAKVMKRNDVQISVMAHSLGTSVVHDALTLLASGTVPGLGGLRPPGMRLRHLFMVANVSRILEKALDGDSDVFTSPVCPISVRGDDAYLGEYFNFKHMLDPFTIPRRFEPQWTGSDFHPVERLLHLGGFNTHGWEHYLDNPEVHIPILNALEGFKVITDEVAHSAIENYKVSPVPLCKSGLEFWTKETREISKALEADPSVPALIELGLRFLVTAAAAKAMCEGGGGGAVGDTLLSVPPAKVAATNATAKTATRKKTAAKKGAAKKSAKKES